MLHDQLTSDILAAFYVVYNHLGYGFLEKVYENALVLELRQHCFTVEQQVPIQVYYKGQIVGQYCADLLIQDKIILELKAAEAIVKAHEAQLVNYLKATNLEVGLLLNFGPQPEFRRKIFTNARKANLGQPGSAPEKRTLR